MPLKLVHDLKIEHSRDAQARQDFVTSLRQFVLNDMATAMKAEYQTKVEPAFRRQHGRTPATQDEIHAAMKSEQIFRFYSSTRYNAQEMCWRSVIPEVQANLDRIRETARQLTAAPKGSLELDASVEVPENVADIDVHLMPGGYISDDELAAGAVYDNGLTVFTAGFIGPHIDDIGQSFARAIQARHPDLKPQKILDCGCTVGHHTVPWKQNYPDAEVYGIDISAPLLNYAHARAESLGQAIHFRQMDATEMRFEDESFDIVFSSQFLHELSLKDVQRYLQEARRILKPGGLLVTMELPPNKELAAYDQFYLDWDAYYNKEPFYRKFRDQDPVELIQKAGWAADEFEQFTIPQYAFTDAKAFKRAVAEPGRFDGETGRMSSDFRYFCFVLRKP